MFIRDRKSKFDPVWKQELSRLTLLQPLSVDSPSLCSFKVINATLPKKTKCIFCSRFFFLPLFQLYCFVHLQLCLTGIFLLFAHSFITSLPVRSCHNNCWQVHNTAAAGTVPVLSSNLQESKQAAIPNQ